MAGKRATQFAEAIKFCRTEMKISKANAIGFIAISTEFPCWMNTKAKRMIAKEEKKEAKKFLNPF